jgi:hypothetical protein
LHQVIGGERQYMLVERCDISRNDEVLWSVVFAEPRKLYSGRPLTVLPFAPNSEGSIHFIAEPVVGETYTIVWQYWSFHQLRFQSEEQRLAEGPNRSKGYPDGQFVWCSGSSDEGR